MSKLTQLLRGLKVRRFRRSIDPSHQLRRHLAEYVLRYGFEIGDFSWGVSPDVRFFGYGKLSIGKYCSVAEGVTFVVGGEHPTETVTSCMLGYPDPLGGLTPTNVGQRASDIVVGSDVWIASNALIRGGVTIGDGAVVALGAVVVDDAPPYSIVLGNPARVISKRFSNDVIAELLELRWWDLSPEQIRSLRPLLEGTDVMAFLAACRQVRGLPPKQRGEAQFAPKPLSVVASTGLAPAASAGLQAAGRLTEAAISSWCAGYAAAKLNLSPERIDVNATFARLGMDSVARADFMIALEEKLNVTITPDDMADHPTIATLARHIALRSPASQRA